jgi:hypothetical protein
MDVITKFVDGLLTTVLYSTSQRYALLNNLREYMCSVL